MSKSIFDLNQTGIQSLNQGINRMSYEQHSASRDVTGDNFSKGQIHINWEVSGQKWWVPSKSYIRFRCSLTDADGEYLENIDNIAPNMGLASHLFQNAEFRINDKVVSRIGSYMPQIDALEQRLTKSKSWFDSIGNSTNFWEESFKVRQSDITEDGFVNSKTDNLTQEYSWALGFPLDVNYSFEVATNTFTFTSATGTIPNVQKIFPKGSQIILRYGDLYTVVNSTATTIEVAMNDLTADIPATNNYFLKIVHGDKGRQLRNFEITWQPPLSIFKTMTALPSGKYSLVLTPQTSAVIQKYAIQSQNEDKIPNLKPIGTTPTPGSHFKFSVNDMYFICNTVEGPRFDNGSYYLDLSETTCDAKDVNSNSLSQKSFDVSPSTYALTAAYQDKRVGNNTIVSSSQFKVFDDLISRWNPVELKLNRFFINYAGSNLPAPDADPSYTADTDLTTQRYTESMIYNSGYFDNGGCETIREFHSRGSYYHFGWPRDGTDRSTRVTVNQSFDTLQEDMKHCNLLLFSHAKKYCRVNVVDGRVTDVQLEDV